MKDIEAASTFISSIQTVYKLKNSIVKTLETEMDYKIDGYRTILLKRVKITDKVIIICFVNENVLHEIKVVEEFMNPSFPSIWIEVTGKGKNDKPLIIGGFYREWSQKGQNIAYH